MRLLILCSSLSLLFGCSQHIIDTQGATNEHTEINSERLCVDELTKFDVVNFPNTYSEMFENCHPGVNNKVAVDKYIQSLVITGKFKKLTSLNLLSENSDKKFFLE